MLTRLLGPIRQLTRNLEAQAARTTELAGRMACWQARAREVVSDLTEVEFRVSSQFGEDGIIDWLIERAAIPPSAHSFIEFGVETYRESNTRFLLQNRNWRGLILDGDPGMIAAIREDGLAWRHDLSARAAFITRENINDLIRGSGFAGEIGLLSIDLDGNDYWIWEAIEAVNPILLITEYNAVLGDRHPILVPYASDFTRSRAHYSHLYFGASIRALCLLAARRDYRFVGTNSAANNAFFVREDYAARFVEGAIERVRACPSRARESRDERGRLSYISGVERLRVISALPVINVETGVTAPLGDLKEVYSPEWLEAMTGRREEPALKPLSALKP